MTDKVKLIIEIPKELYENKKGYLTNMDAHIICKAVQNGIPLDTVKAEIEKEIIPRNSDDYDHDVMYQNLGLRIALKIIENIDNKDPNDMTHIFDGVTEIPKDAFKGWYSEELSEQIRAERESCTGATEKDYVNPTHQGKK